MRSLFTYPIVILPDEIQAYLISTTVKDKKVNTVTLHSPSEDDTDRGELINFRPTQRLQGISSQQLKLIRNLWIWGAGFFYGLLGIASIYQLIYQRSWESLIIGLLGFTVISYLRYMGLKILSVAQIAHHKDQQQSDRLFWQRNKEQNQIYHNAVENQLRRQLKLTNKISRRKDNVPLNIQLQRGTLKEEAQKGVTEVFFLSYLLKFFSDCEIKSEYFALTEDKGYTTDFSIVEPSLGFGIDLEIDEPYDGKNKIPHHCTDNNKDSNRNLFFAERGWIVVRVSEYQIVSQPQSVCKLIAQIFDRLLDKSTYLETLASVEDLKVDPCWNSLQAKQMVADKYRELYLDKAGIYKYNPNQEELNRRKNLQGNFRSNKKTKYKRRKKK